MTTTMQLIAKQTVGSGGASSVTFSNIPQTYTDLKLVMSAKGSAATTRQNVLIAFNGSGSSFAWQGLYGYGGSAGANSGNNQFVGNVPMASNVANAFGTEEIYIPNYTSTTKAKTIMTNYAVENNGSSNFIGIDATSWNPGTQDNIESITLSINSSGDFIEFSTFYLYGISNSTTTQATTVPYASGGDVITTDGSYWYHAFKYSGSFTPLKNLTADVLVVAGGGGGGGNYGAGGGGGAGGLLTFSAQALTANTGLTCTVGAGGAAGANSPGNATNGGDSQFGALTLVKGGGGGGTYQNNGALGGSGGGGGGGDATTSGGSATSGQGNAGGGGPGAGSTYTAGGGGGAGGAGTAGAATNVGGNGGIGYYNSLTDAMGVATATGVLSSTHYYYAGGGGGGAGAASGPYNGTAGTGGTGGGGAGATNSNNGTAGTANTGGGGGGTRQGNGAAGGSGIIIVRYAV